MQSLGMVPVARRIRLHPVGGLRCDVCDAAMELMLSRRGPWENCAMVFTWFPHCSVVASGVDDTREWFRIGDRTISWVCVHC